VINTTRRRRRPSFDGAEPGEPACGPVDSASSKWSGRRQHQMLSFNELRPALTTTPSGGRVPAHGRTGSKTAGRAPGSSALLSHVVFLRLLPRGHRAGWAAGVWERCWSAPGGKSPERPGSPPRICPPAGAARPSAAPDQRCLDAVGRPPPAKARTSWACAETLSSAALGVTSSRRQRQAAPDSLDRTRVASPSSTRRWTGRWISLSLGHGRPRESAPPHLPFPKKRKKNSNCLIMLPIRITFRRGCLRSDASDRRPPRPAAGLSNRPMGRPSGPDQQPTSFSLARLAWFSGRSPLHEFPVRCPDRAYPMGSTRPTGTARHALDIV